MSQARFYTPREAEAAFYAAFVKRDLEAMMAVWAEDDTVSCVHPMGPAHAGRTAVRRSWQGVFRTSPPMKFMIEERKTLQEGSLAVHVVLEHIRVGPAPAGPPLVATNVYRLTPDGWRMVLHHASPVPAPKKAAPKVLH
jgi:ketosteroid isomerase-like protein